MEGTGITTAAKKHRLRIIFDGVIAVGPPPPQRGGERQGPYFGVMARSTRRLSERSRRLKEEPPQYIPMHVPSVYTTLRPVENTRQPDQVFQLVKGGVRWNIWHPIRERLEFRFDDSGKPGTLTYVHEDAPAQLEPSEVRLHSIRKVPDAREISPDRTHLLVGLMSADAPVREEAAAQILVPWGEVAGGGIRDKQDGVDVFFESPGGRGSKPMTVVPNTVVSVDVESVEVATYSLDSGEPLDSLKFRLTEDADIWVSNGDPSDVAIDLDNLSEADRQTILKPESIREMERFVAAFRPTFGIDADLDTVRSFVADVFTSGGSVVAPPSAQQIQPNRSSKVDIDFELFSTITGPPPGSGSAAELPQAAPVPVKADLLPFEGPNCLVKQVEASEDLFLRSNGR